MLVVARIVCRVSASVIYRVRKRVYLFNKKIPKDKVSRDVWHSSYGIDSKVLAEKVGFEPTLEFPLNTLSKRAPSTTRPPLQQHHCYESITEVGWGKEWSVENWG